MKSETSDAQAEDADAVRHRDVFRLTAALAAFGAAMGFEARTGWAKEANTQDMSVTKKNGQMAQPGTSTKNKNQINIKKDTGSQKYLKRDTSSGSK